MSVPRSTSNPVPVPSHSSSPSKSSLRRVSGGTQNPSARNLLPSPHFDEPVISASYDSPKQEAEELQEESQHHEIDASRQQNQPPQPFQPFFTLIEDSINHEHFHPTVHYIFADDEADIITEAALRSLRQTQPGVPEDDTSQALAGEENAESDERYLPPSQNNVREHYLVLDVQLPSTAPSAGVEASGSGNVSAGSTTSSIATYEVTNAYCMSADWQVLRTGITQAPTIGDTEGDDGLMLRIEGRRYTPSNETQSPTGKVEDMIEKFSRGLQEVRLMMEAGGQGQAAIGEGAEVLR
jgi:hypothetical protein